jgi:hypothetical protein
MYWILLLLDEGPTFAVMQVPLDDLYYALECECILLTLAHTSQT